MAKQVRVTRAEKTAAEMIVRRSARTGQFVSREVQKIANARPSTNERRQQPQRPATSQS